MTDLKPGRELDGLIAEKVMGCFSLDRDEYATWSCDCNLTSDLWHCGESGSLKSYSTDIAAAWEVVEKLRDDNFAIEEHGTHWKARFGTEWAGAETAQHAICLAALRACNAS